jgi:hypothetical protein
VAFTPAEIGQIKGYLGYPTLVRAELLDHGIIGTGGTEMLFVLEANLENVQESAEALVRVQMGRIACIVQQQQTHYAMQAVGSAGGVTFNGIEGIVSMNLAYTLETDRLADLLHVPKAATSLLHRRIGGTGEGAVIEPF